MMRVPPTVPEGRPAMTDHRPWYASYQEGVPETLAPYPEKNLFSLLGEAAERHPNAPAVVWAVPGGKTLTYSQLVAETERFSGALQKLGVKQGDRVALLLPNCPQYVIAYYATVRMGGVIVGNNPLYTSRELAHQLSDCGAEVVVVLDSLWPNLKAIEEHYRPRETVVTSVTDYMKFPINKLAPMKLKKEAQQEAPLAPGPRRRSGEAVEGRHEDGGGSAGGGRGRRQEGRGRVYLRRRHHRAVEGGDALALQPRVERDAGRRLVPGPRRRRRGRDVRAAVLPLLRHDRVHEHRHL